MKQNYEKKPKYVDGGIIRKRGEKRVAGVNYQGKRQRKSFNTIKEAEQWIIEKRSLIRKQGESALRLTERQSRDAVDALKKLKGTATLCAAVDFWAQHNKPVGGTKNIDELLTEYVNEKIKANRRPHTIIEVKTRVGRFARSYGHQGVHEITANDVKQWVDNLEVQGVTRGNYIRAIRGFFKFAERKNLIQYNPADGLTKPSRDERLPEFMSAKDVKHFFQEIEASQPEVAAFFAVCFFAGLRTSEAQQLKWKDIDFK
ncbi:MAG: tyrosine-type recombinase/integrase [Kiritimatiellae bacterium]|nr:tyrosine-type recombinase/integrase [Kiritimatiellia bacterium]